jgi:hypothetical protein
VLKAEPLPTATLSGSLSCITQDGREPAGAEYLAACDDNPVHLTCSVFCPPECGGHMVCDPCFRLGTSKGLVRSY